MLIKSLSGLIAAAALGLLAGCGTPCGAPGRLCAPAEPNTSAPAAALPPVVHEAAGPVARAAPAATTRIGLLLPLQSDKLGQAAEAVRAGFMAGYGRERAGFEVDLVVTGDSPEDALEAYRHAATHDDIIVGPLPRQAVDALAASAELSKPTIALNHPERQGPLPARMLVIGLSIEDEARQVAQWASSEHPGARALVLGGAAAWQQRAARAFEARWTQLGHASRSAELAGADGLVSQAALDDLKSGTEADPPDLLFAALDAAQLRQVRAALGAAIPCYGASSVNPGREAIAELNGVRVLDLPWEVGGGAAQAYPRWTDSQSLDMDRLYALGIDAFRVARAIALRPGTPFTLDGVTGTLAAGADGVERTEAAAVYQDGALQPVR
jgi:outer membrane PBP1 activator LpoA protein